jgi:hypothetical protein
MERKELLKTSVEFSNLLGIEPFNCSWAQRSINLISENFDDFKELKLNYGIVDVENDKEVFFKISNISFEEEINMVSFVYGSEGHDSLTLKDLIDFIEHLRKEKPNSWGSIILNCENLFVINNCVIIGDKLCFSFKPNGTGVKS